MKKQVTGVILTLAAFCANLSADSWNNGECCYDPCGGGGGFFDGFTVGAEGLYLWAYEDDNDYAGITAIATPAVTASTVAVDYRRPKFNNRLGYRVEVAYANPCSCWGLEANYFHYNTNARDRIGLLDVTALSPFIVPTSVSSFTALTANGVLATAYKRAETQLKLSVNRVDLNVGREFCINDCWQFGPSVGVRWLNLDHRWDTAYIRDLVASVGGSDLIRLRDKYDGVGLRGGFCTRWTFCGGFGIYGGVGTSILCGNDRVERFELATQNVSATVINTTALATRSRHQRPMWTGETSLGIEWATTFCGSQTLRILLGWEYQIYFHAARFDQTFVPALALPAIAPVTPQAINFRTTNLVLQGFVFGATYTF